MNAVYICTYLFYLNSLSALSYSKCSRRAGITVFPARVCYLCNWARVRSSILKVAFIPGLQIVCRVVVYDCHKIKAKCYRSKNPRARRQIIVKYLAITYLHIREHSSVIKQINILLYLSACSFKCGSLCPLDFQSHLWKACLCCSAAGSGWWSFKCQLKSTHTLIEPIPQLCVWNHICKWQRKQSYYDLLSLFNSCVLQCDGKKWGSLRCKLQLFWLKWVIFLSRTPA